MNSNRISVFGGTGFIGGVYLSLYEEDSILISRNQRSAETNNVLYLISTNDNYNVFNDPFLDIETNLRVLIETLEECKKIDDLVFNFISTCQIYGQISDFPVSEDSVCNPTGFYSITKRTAEQMLISYCKTFNLKYRILRCGNVFGSSDHKVSAKRNVFQHLIHKLMKNEDIELYDGGKVIRDYMHVSDMCRAINLIIRKAKTNQIINVGSGKYYSMLELIQYAKDKIKSSSQISFVESSDFHKIVGMEDMILNVDKLKELEFEPCFSIWDSIDELFKR